MRKFIFMLFVIAAQTAIFAQELEYYPEGTKWTEIRLDTLKYDSWYSRVGDEWVPNFETVEYYVKGYYRSDPSQDEPFMSVFTDGPEWTDSLTLLLDEQGNAVLATVLNNYRMAFTLAYEFDWQVGDEPYYQELLGANTTAFPPVGLHKFGTIEEIKEGNFGGENPLKYVDLDGVRIIQGIGVTTWNDGECLFGPVKPYEALSFFKQNTGQETQSATRHYRSMLVHFERNGEVLYDVWPEKEDGSSQSQGYKVIVDGLKFYLSEETHEAIIDSYNTWAGELVLPSSIYYDGQGYIVKGISWCAFYNCKELTRVRIPKTIENVIHYDLSSEYSSSVSPDYMNPFVGCTSLVSIEVDEDNPIMSSKEGVMFSKDGTKLYAYPAGNKQENYAVPQGVTYIGGASFSYSADLVSVELPETVERMHSAFDECRNLKKINLPKKLAYLDASTFRNCSSLESIDIPNGVRGIGEQTFWGCVSMKTIDMPESIQTIGSLAFRECKLDALIIRGILENQTMSHSLFSGLDESTKLYVPTSEIERYKKIYAGPILPLDSYSGSTETIEDPQELEYYPEGTKWTEIRLDTLKYDSWYSKVGDEWVPNYEMVEYYVKGEIKNNCLVGEGFPDYFRCIYSDGPTWSDSLTFLLMESKYGVQATIPLFEEDMLMLIPGTAYTFGKWETGQKLGFRTISGANIPSIPAVGYGSYGTIQEIKEGYWGGTHSLKCAYLDNGRQVIHGIGVTAWNGETCLLGAIIYGIYEPQHYRSMLVHFERDGEVLYDVWPEKEDGSSQSQGYASRPFVEEGKTWTLCSYREGADPTEKIGERIEYQYLQGDTLIGGLRYKRWWIDEGENVPPLYVGAAREENLVVYFCPPGKTESQVIYDFSSPVGTIGWYNNFYSDLAVIYDVTLGENRIINTETYKGWCRDVSFNGTTVTWLQGVGYMGLVNLPFGYMRLLSCTVGDEVLYYDASLMENDEVKKKKLDFTHVIKAQPRAPRHRIQQQDGDMPQDGETLLGEYSDTELFVRLNPLAGYYTATLTDASGRAVFQKNVMTDCVLALSTELTGYALGDYVLTLENQEEIYSATLNIEPNGIRPTPGPSRNGGELYDLQGRRLQKAPEKGMYIQDGKKILVK